MTKVISMVIQSTDNLARKQTNTVTHINPEATNAQIRTFAQKIIALTTDSYQGVTKVTKESVI